MSFDNTHNVRWRFQGLKSSCWLTCIEMLMQSKHGNVHGPGKTSHSQAAKDEFKKNKGSNIELHMADYDLDRNEHLRGERDPIAWTTALRQGPVLAEGHYGWSRFGVGRHVIVIAGISKSGQLAYFNPNMYAVLPHPKDKVSYMSIDRCVTLSHDETGLSSFWQTREDVARQRAGP